MRNSLVRRPDPFSLEALFDDDLFWPKRMHERLDIYKEGNAMVVEVEIPGFNKEDISLDFNGDILTIKAQHKEERQEEKRHYVMRSRSLESYSRQLRIENIDSKAIEAAYEEGILKVKLPMLELQQQEVKKIEVK
ncbi:MAG: HSP20 family protein [Erysipelotrichaceae bacterium]|nr:MAG: HSP20 family [Erysipelotrichaceae bacterium]TXT16621.1 MAG: HSP20 family protein [Erysipelotrichaceae bacterium]